ncbi:MAG: NfeD family protein [Solirubrobacterales bacterium]|nr:NfeD family protein [Solirubrobacterales bacterium]
MTLLGILLLLLGVVVVVAEAHVPGGLLGVLAGVALIAGVLALTAGAGVAAAVAIPVAVGVGLAAGGWGLLGARHVRRIRQGRPRSGPEGLAGQLGVVRRWNEPGGQIYLDGALWRARRSWGSDADDAPALHEGDVVVVERVMGLTLCVRPAEDWELIA